MKRAKIPDGEKELPCGAHLLIANGRELTVFVDPTPAPTPSRTRVQQQVFELTGLRVWLEVWPDDRELHRGSMDPGKCALVSHALILDYDERIAACRDLATLQALLCELAHHGLPDSLGWQRLVIDPYALPNFGGKPPEIPASFFWCWELRPDADDTIFPARALSWDAHFVLVAADPRRPPFCLPRRPARLFVGPLACTDTESFGRLADVLPWDGSYAVLGDRLELLSAHSRSGASYSPEDSRVLGVVVRNLPVAREVIAVGDPRTLRARYSTT